MPRAKLSADKAKKQTPKKEGKDDAGRFLPGNKFWEARSSHGRKPIFETAEDLHSACHEYFEWVEANPLFEAKAFAHQGSVTMASLPKMRAMTLAGLCIFLGISRDTWNDWRESRPDFSEVQRETEEIIYAQKFSGAAADLLNASIIVRDLGLAEKKEHSGPDGSPIPVSVVERRIVKPKTSD